MFMDKETVWLIVRVKPFFVQKKSFIGIYNVIK